MVLRDLRKQLLLSATVEEVPSETIRFQAVFRRGKTGDGERP